MAREHRRLPRRAFVALGVAQQAEQPPAGGVEAGGERGAARGREALAERPAREVDAAHLPLRVRPEQRALARERVELVVAEQATQAERCVQRERGVPLREDEPVAFAVVRSDASQHPAVEDGDEVGDRESRSDVADVGALRLLEHDAPNLAREDLGLIRHLAHFFTARTA